MILVEEKEIINMLEDFKPKIEVLITKIKKYEALSSDFDEPCEFFIDLLNKCLVGTVYYDNYILIANYIVQNMDLIKKFLVVKNKDDIINIVKDISEILQLIFSYIIID